MDAIKQTDEVKDWFALPNLMHQLKAVTGSIGYVSACKKVKKIEIVLISQDYDKERLQL